MPAVLFHSLESSRAGAEKERSIIHYQEIMTHAAVCCMRLDVGKKKDALLLDRMRPGS